MKKWIFCILMFSMNVFANDFLIEEWNKLNETNHLYFYHLDQCKPVILINKIEKEKNISKREIYKTLLELELEAWETRFQFEIDNNKKFIPYCRNEIQKSNNVDDIKEYLLDLEMAENNIIKMETSLEIIKEWRIKYLGEGE